MKAKRKVLFFLPSNTGGAERMTVTIAKMLPLDRFDVKFIIIHRSLGTIVKFIPKEYEIIHIPIYNIYCAATLKMIRIIKKEKPDIVFSSLLYLNVRLIIAAKFCRVKVIVRNNIDLSRTLSRINPLLVKLTYKLADKVIAQQDEMHDEIIHFTKIPKEKVITLYNPLDIDNINDKIKESSPFVKNNQINFLWVGRFAYEKGQDLIVKALKIVRNTIPNAHLYLVGSYNLNSSYDMSVKQYVCDNNLSEYIHFVGFDANPYRWIYNCDCYVMPSRLEGLPNSLIEAMYLGKPVVATRCVPIVSRIVKDEYNGILVESENVESISKGMIKALSLNNFSMTYKAASSEDFINLFS